MVPLRQVIADGARFAPVRKFVSMISPVGFMHAILSCSCALNPAASARIS